VKESLQRLKLKYVDMITVHDVEFSDNLNIVINETVPSLRELQKEGLVRYVGISGYPLNVLLFVAQRVKLDYVLTYCHYNLQNTMLAEYIDAFEACGVGLISAAPIALRFFTKIGPPAWHPAKDEMKALVPQLNKYCDDAGTDIAKVAVQYSLRLPLAKNGRIACTLSGMAAPAEVDAAIECLDQEPNKGLVDKILKDLKPYHNYTWPSGNAEFEKLPGPPK